RRACVARARRPAAGRRGWRRKSDLAHRPEGREDVLGVSAQVGGVLPVVVVKKVLVSFGWARVSGGKRLSGVVGEGEGSRVASAPAGGRRFRNLDRGRSRFLASLARRRTGRRDPQW